MGNGCWFVRWVAGLLILLAAASGTYAADDPASISTLADWKLEFHEQSAPATISHESGAMRFDITRKPPEEWYVQAYHDGKTVRDGSVYTLRFAAKASTNRTIRITVQTDDSPWRQVMDPVPVDLTTQWKTYSVQLRIKDAQGAPVRLPQFLIGQATGTVWIKDFAVTDAASAKTTPRPGNSNSGSGQRPDQTTIATADPSTPGSTDSGILEPLSSWQIQCSQGAEAATQMVDDVMQAKVTKRGWDRWHVQLYQIPGKLVARRRYILTISIRSDAPRKLTFLAQNDQEPYDRLLPFTELDIGPEWTQYKLKFALNKVYPAHTRLSLQFGDAPGKVEFRDASLVEAPRK